MKILYEDPDILVVDKPSGISVDGIQEMFPKLFLAHRLDKETSGVLVLAKNETAREFLQQQFKSREVKKTYIALVVGEVKKDRGVVDKPIGRTRSDPRKRHAGRGVVGKERDAVTEYKVLKRFETSEGKFTYLEIHPKTGRTHQIRVHMKFLNHPVACDPLYNPKGACPEGLSRMALHAKSIEFKNVDGEMIKIEASVPEEFEKILQKTLSLP